MTSAITTRLSRMRGRRARTVLRGRDAAMRPGYPTTEKPICSLCIGMLLTKNNMQSIPATAMRRKH